jgi:DNA-binding PadR family transcriptional regulator
MAILGVLAGQDLHGYEIKRRIVDDLNLFASISFGSMYPALARLEKLAFVEVTQGRFNRVQPKSIPFTGSLGGEKAASIDSSLINRFDTTRTRGKKVYAITESGRIHFFYFMNDDFNFGEDDLAFRVRFAFASLIEPEMRLKLLERRRSCLENRLLKVRDSNGRESRLDSYAKSAIEHSQSETQNDISWIDTLIQSERSRINEHTI